jgi:hypothetical protein
LYQEQHSWEEGRVIEEWVFSSQREEGRLFDEGEIGHLDKEEGELFF